MLSQASGKGLFCRRIHPQGVAERIGFRPNGYLILSSLSTLLFIQAIRAFLAGIYHDNLVALSINASVLYTLFLFSPAVYLLLRHPQTGRVLIVSASLLALFRVAMNLSWGTCLHLPLSGLAVASFMVLLPALLQASRASSSEGWLILGLAMVLAFAVDTAQVLLGASWDPRSGLSGMALPVPAGALMVYISLTSKPPQLSEVQKGGRPRCRRYRRLYLFSGRSLREDRLRLRLQRHRRSGYGETQDGGGHSGFGPSPRSGDG